MTNRPRRSVLYMPGANAKVLEKAKTLACDAIIMDMEDAVAPEMKQTARDTIAAALSGGGYGAREIIIRTNGINTEYFAEDLKMAVAAKPDAILVPKVQSKEEVISIDNQIRALNNDQPIDIWAMIETPRAILDIFNICSASETAPFKALVMGTNDLAKETGAILDVERAPFLFALSAAINGAKCFGMAVIDGVFNDIQNNDGYVAQCNQGKAFGFDGKTLIHPNQITACNDIFAPKPEEVAFARAIVAAFANPENAGKGVLKVEGKMTEILHRDMALKTIAIAEAIAAMQ
jgi:citrate lyase subunit beta / citryl-CoA lyase